MVKFLNVAFLLLIIPFLSSAQINKVSYRLSFDPNTNLYDCYLHINEGSAKKVKERVQLNAQLTLLVPEGSAVEIVQNYMPLQDNQSYDGKKPMKWNKANMIKKPASDPFHDYVSIVPQLSPASFYNDLNPGDQVKLFSAKISHVDNCGDDIKLFDNIHGVTSTDIGMSGGDFRNGFTVGGVKQKYTKNEVTVTPAIEVVDQIMANTKKGIFLDAPFNQNAKYGPYTYEWQTPEGNRIESKYINIDYPSKEDYGMYQLIVTDARGCRQMKSIEIQNRVADPIHELANNEKIGDQNGIKHSVDGRTSSSNSVSIYPNPASSEFFINLETEIGTKVDIILTDALGRSILKNIVSTVAYQTHLNIQVSTDDLSAGAYNVITRMNGKESAHKVIIVK